MLKKQIRMLNQWNQIGVAFCELYLLTSRFCVLFLLDIFVFIVFEKFFIFFEI